MKDLINDILACICLGVGCYMVIFFAGVLI